MPKIKDKFKVQGASLHRTKHRAKVEAGYLRFQGFRAEVQRASKITRKRSPSCQWVVFKGQKRRH
jgi:hypothetical protein